MSLLRRDQAIIGTPQEYLARQRRARTGMTVTATTAQRHSAVWACLRLRSELIGMMPVDTFRRVTSEGVDVEIPKPLSLVEPSSWGDGQPMSIGEWLSTTQWDLDRYGNSVGLIVTRDGQGLPQTVDPVPFEDTRITVSGGRVVNYRLGKTDYSPREVWHERQFMLPGVPIGLSPIAAAAWSIQAYLSAQAFAAAWFQGSAIPSGELTWNAGKLDPKDVEIHKARFMASINDGEPFVHGKDWTYTPYGANASTSAFLGQLQWGVSDVTRFLGVPGDMIDAPVQGSSVTYANITQRNLQLLIMNLAAPIKRREDAMSRWLPRPRFVKLNTDAILRMDPEQRTNILLARVGGKTLTPSEARAQENLPPFTPEQLDELKALQIITQTPAVTKTSGGTP